MKSQLASPTFTPTYAALVAILNTKFPEIGELLLKRVISQVCSTVCCILMLQLADSAQSPACTCSSHLDGLSPFFVPLLDCTQAAYLNKLSTAPSNSIPQW